MNKQGDFYPSFVKDDVRYSNEDCKCIESVVERLRSSRVRRTPSWQ
jgi:hypothetical protein